MYSNAKASRNHFVKRIALVTVTAGALLAGVQAPGHTTAASGGASGQAAYLKVKGALHNWIKGSVTTNAHKDWIKVIGFTAGVDLPVDASTGQSTGRHHHKPLTITKLIDKATPLLFEALVTNENIVSAELKFFGPSGSGAEEATYTITLENAVISSIRQHGNTNETGEDGHKDMEDISFTYRKITVTWEDGGITGSDTWGPN